MRNILLFLIIFLLIGGGIIIASFIFIEKPAQEEQVVYNNLTLRCLNEKEEYISCNYYIVSYESVLSNGTTLENGYLKESVLSNRTYYVFMEKDGYYSNYKEYSANKDESISLILRKQGKLNASFEGNLNSQNIILNISSKGYVKNLDLCEKWSFNILSSNLQNFTRLENENYPSRMLYDRCYDLNQDLDNSYLLLNLSIMRFGIINPNDYIDIYLIDKDYLYNNLINLTEKEGKDFALKDYKLTIK